MIDSDLFGKVVVFDKLTRTSAEAAEQIGCQVAQIAKSIVFENTSGQAVLVVACGINRVDNEKLGLFKANADFVKKKTGYVIGGIPPWGYKEKLITYIDKDLEQYQEIWAAAGKNNAVFKTTFKELVEKSGGVAMAISFSK